MASAGNPMAGGAGGLSALLPTILGALSKRTQDAGAGGNSAAIASENQGADPTMVLNQLNEVHKALGLVFVRTFQTLPNVANQVSATMKALSRAIKEAQQASNVGEVVGQQQNPPVNFSAAAQGMGTEGQPETPPMGQ